MPAPPHRHKSTPDPAAIIHRCRELLDEWERFEQASASAAELDGDITQEDAAPILQGVLRLEKLGVRFAPEFLAEVREIKDRALWSNEDGDSEPSVDDGLEDDDPDFDMSDEGLDCEDDDRENDDPDLDGSDENLTEHETNVDEHHQLDGARAERGNQ